MTKPASNTLRRAIDRTTPDTWIGVVILVAAVVYWLEAVKIQISPLDGPVGASGLPKSLAYVLAGLAVLLIARSVGGVNAHANSEPAQSTQGWSSTGWIKPHLRALGMFAIGVGYVLLLPMFGYTISIASLLVSVSLFNGARLNLRTILVAVIGAAVCQLLFVQFLGIALPVGELPSLFVHDP